MSTLAYKKPGPRGGPRLPWKQRIFDFFERAGDDDCWIWNGAQGGAGGYGQYAVPGVGKTSAHRAVYIALVGPIPDGMVLDHLCENPPCVNPRHMNPTTQRANLLRSARTFQGRNARKTHCPKGHGYTPENTYVEPKGSRRCKTCARAADVARRRRKGAKPRYADSLLHR